MHRTEGANKTADDKFTDGPPGTTVNDDWLNAIQEEIAYVIESAGITLKTAATETNAQLHEALLKTVPMPRGYIDGLVMSNSGVDADHDISITVGKCRNTGDSNTIVLSSAIIKQIDVAWAEGNNAGGFPSGLGVVAADTWYHVFIIMSADGTKVDVGYDTSLIATNLLADATDYSVYRRIGSVLTEAANNIIGFKQHGDRFYWDAPPYDHDAVIGIAANQVFSISTPSGVQTEAKLNVYGNSVGTSWAINLTCPDADDILPVQGGDPIGNNGVASDANQHHVTTQVHVYTDTFTQIRARATVNVILKISTVGYIDPRGKDV